MKTGVLTSIVGRSSCGKLEQLIDRVDRPWLACTFGQTHRDPRICQIWRTQFTPPCSIGKPRSEGRIRSSPAEPHFRTDIEPHIAPDHAPTNFLHHFARAPMPERNRLGLI